MTPTKVPISQQNLDCKLLTNTSSNIIWSFLPASTTSFPSRILLISLFFAPLLSLLSLFYPSPFYTFTFLCPSFFHFRFFAPIPFSLSLVFAPSVSSESHQLFNCSLRSISMFHISVISCLWANFFFGENFSLFVTGSVFLLSQLNIGSSEKETMIN